MKTEEQIRQRLVENGQVRKHLAELAAMPGNTEQQKEVFRTADQVFVSCAATLNWVLDEEQRDNKSAVYE